jgi:hypothetical protein
VLLRFIGARKRHHSPSANHSELEMITDNILHDTDHANHTLVANMLLHDERQTLSEAPDNHHARFRDTDST